MRDYMYSFLWDFHNWTKLEFYSFMKDVFLFWRMTANLSAEHKCLSNLRDFAGHRVTITKHLSQDPAVVNFIKKTFFYHNKATWSPEISSQQVQKLTPQFFVYVLDIDFPLSLSTWSTIWGNHPPFNFMLKFPISTI